MIKLNVWLTTFEGSRVHAGELVTTAPDQQGRLQGQFRYRSDYLQSRSAFSLDPVHLPLSSKLFSADRPKSGVHGVFEDSLPDDWGRKLLIRRYMLGRDKQRIPQLLLLLGGQGIGALTYEDDTGGEKQKETVDSCHLPELQKLAEKFEHNPAADDSEMTLLFQAGSSPGGARPKVLVREKKNEYLAKLPSIRDTFNVVSLEAATMELAGLAGIETAKTKRVICGGKDVLLVKRFDVRDDGGRNHLISMQSLLGADGYYNLGYRNMAGVIRNISGSPKRDLRQLFKQLVFNVLIGNTDDHLKNFSMMYDDLGWHLTPAFDLTPNIGANREHVLHINDSYLPPDRAALIREASFFMLKQRQEAESIIDIVLSAVQNWRELFRKHDVPEHDINVLGSDIDQRLKRVAKR